MVPVRIVLSACCLMAACSGTPSPQLPLSVAEDLQNQFVVDSSDYLAEARAADAALDYALCLDNLQRFASAEPEQCDASFWQWQARVAENSDNAQAALRARLQWLKFSPNDVWLRIDIADSYSRLQRLEDGLLHIDMLRPVPEPEVRKIKIEKVQPGVKTNIQKISSVELKSVE